MDAADIGIHAMIFQMPLQFIHHDFAFCGFLFTFSHHQHDHFLHTRQNWQGVMQRARCCGRAIPGYQGLAAGYSMRADIGHKKNRSATEQNDLFRNLLDNGKIRVFRVGLAQHDQIEVA